MAKIARRTARAHSCPFERDIVRLGLGLDLAVLDEYPAIPGPHYVPGG